MVACKAMHKRARSVLIGLPFLTLVVIVGCRFHSLELKVDDGSLTGPVASSNVSSNSVIGAVTNSNGVATDYRTLN
jgi:hypothetical protein